MVVEHPWLVQQRLSEQQGAPGIAGQEHALRQRRRRTEVDGLGAHVRLTLASRTPSRADLA
jgi:hypothetical protein